MTGERTEEDWGAGVGCGQVSQLERVRGPRPLPPALPQHKKHCGHAGGTLNTMCCKLSWAPGPWANLRRPEIRWARRVRVDNTLEHLHSNGGMDPEHPGQNDDVDFALFFTCGMGGTGLRGSRTWPAVYHPTRILTTCTSYPMLKQQLTALLFVPEGWGVLD